VFQLRLMFLITSDSLNELGGIITTNTISGHLFDIKSSIEIELKCLHSKRQILIVCHQPNYYFPGIIADGLGTAVGR